MRHVLVVGAEAGATVAPWWTTSPDYEAGLSANASPAPRSTTRGRSPSPAPISRTPARKPSSRHARRGKRLTTGTRRRRPTAPWSPLPRRGAHEAARGVRRQGKPPWTTLANAGPFHPVSSRVHGKSPRRPGRRRRRERVRQAPGAYIVKGREDNL